MQVNHCSPFASSLDAIIDHDGSEGRVAIVKASFTILDDGRLVVADEQDPVRVGDIHMGPPGQSSVLHEADGAFFKVGTDVVILGAAFSPHGRPARQFQISVHVKDVRADLMVFGDRTWSYGPLGLTMTDPVPCVTVPICWERSFGGVDPFTGNAEDHAWERRNPIGSGFRVTKSRVALDGAPLPNFEDPLTLIKNWSDKPRPVGLGYTGRSWMPRIRYAGIFDEAWRRDRMPLLPADFDYRYFSAAADGLSLPYLTGRELIRLVNLTARGDDVFRLPGLSITFQGCAFGRRFEAQGRLDTIEIETLSRRLVLTWRHRFHVRVNEAADSVVASFRRFD